MTEPLFIDDMIDIARQVHADRDVPLRTMATREYFTLHLTERGHSIDGDMFGAAIGIVRAAIGPKESNYLFGFPYPDLVVAALALVGRSGDWSNLYHDIVDQRDVDYPDGACVPECDGRCPDYAEGVCDRACSGRCHHYTQIGAAYEQAGHAALHIEMLVDATERALQREGAPITPEER